MKDINVTELARRLKIPTKDLLERLPQMGFPIGARAIKIKAKMAQEIIEKWEIMNKIYEGKLKAETDAKKAQLKASPTTEAPKTLVKLPAFVTVREFAERLGLPVNEVIKTLMKNGIFASLNERIDFDTASIIGDELGFGIEKDEEVAVEVGAKEEKIAEILENEKELQSRPPVVVVMGHVDHGKTKLLDTIRKANVVEGEAGGITQHIGAYQVKKKGRKITFIDTPGHEAFTAMRSRGARIADIAILIVAADDSIKPQTVEALRIIEQAGIPMIVAINKIDKPDANIDRVKSDMAQHNITPQEWGGKTATVEVSAMEGTGIDDLLDTITIIADDNAQDIQANPKGQVVGTVIESHVDKGEGPVATMLVQNGTLEAGKYIGIDGTLYGRIRAMKNWDNKTVDKAPPSTPVKILGFKVAPKVGDIVVVSDSQKDLEKKIAYQDIVREQVASPLQKSLGDDEDESIKKFNIIIKTDMLGSLEAINESLEKIYHPEISLKIASKGLGNITESDVLQAESTGSLLVGFHVKPTANAELLARDKGVEIKLYKVIYDLLNEVEERLNTLLGDEVIETKIGEARILAMFSKKEGMFVVGCKVKEGRVAVNSKARIFRSGVELGEGEITNVQIAKESVTDVEVGNEFGMLIKTKVPLEEGDSIKVFTVTSKDKTL